MPRQSRAEARKQWQVLEKMEPGIVYSIDNTTYAKFEPRALFKVIRIDEVEDGGAQGA